MMHRVLWRRVNTTFPIINVPIVLTSRGDLGDTGKKTAFWVEEFAAPYYAPADAGVGITPC